ncbi:hypothetical protein S58_59950 [Bradyrhizobium oligotrophicum S58]|uniref:Uncharacterized protein n=1 Tax=Bradyrhizobium oligotrophicum S58 TaxID=1245469 RepID=M4ZEN5_9BRAD|nr:hypothetical protein S58_59950 [Bradyrhizobium oligotrophicum S58]
MFEVMVLSLGRFRLFKTEDVGRVHAATSFRAADYRVVLDDGDQWLVEVKNARCENPQKQRTTMSAAYLALLQAYADAVTAAGRYRKSRILTDGEIVRHSSHRDSGRKPADGQPNRSRNTCRGADTSEASIMNKMNDL